MRLIVAGSDLITANDRQVIDYAVFRLRDIYSAAGIGVGRVTRDLRTAANSQGHATVNSSADLDATGRDLTADGDFVPVVIPANMNVSETRPDGSVFVTSGRSPRPGPCSPRTGTGMRSVVIDIVGEETGRTLAHEVGHYLGAPHPSPADNSLMTQTGSVTSGNAFNAVGINAADVTRMRGHCTIRPALDYVVYNPADFTTEELASAARGEVAALSPQLAVTLLRAKLGDEAAELLTGLARDDTADPRGRYAAALALASYPSARQTLASLADSSERLVAEAASQALQQLPPADD
ncbi:hypothetical protein ACFV30_41885 [Streptomyces sp. NPDC059752]|uniref:hypothetical protein n=1 Tax=unclassified Streptomyces TaxID=2593676 RepID=UPI00364DE4C6